MKIIDLENESEALNRIIHSLKERRRILLEEADAIQDLLATELQKDPEK